jgi:hypothetical protein
MEIAPITDQEKKLARVLTFDISIDGLAEYGLVE